MKGFILLIFAFFLIYPVVSAGLFGNNDLTFIFNQTDYYFKVGESAIVGFEIDNTYGKQIDGVLKNTYSQEVQQGNSVTSSTNSQSISFSAKDGLNTEGLNFGSVNTPTVMTINLEFSYVEKNPRIVKIKDIKVYFVKDEEQKQNEQNEQKSKSEKNKEGEQQEQQRPTTEQKLQNNQMNQDSSALKKQMERQQQEQQEREQEFQKELSENEEFQKEHQELLEEGYKPKSGNFNPGENKSGNFDIEYKKENGETAEMKGEMKDGEMENLQTLTSEDKKEMMEQLGQNKKFQKQENQLDKENFKNMSTKFSLDENKTQIKIEYKTQENETATITADVINGTIEKVMIEKDSEKDSHLSWIWIFWIISLGSLGYFFYRKYFKKLKTITGEITENIVDEKPFDYKAESKKLIKEAIELFDNGNHKDAYGKAGQSFRLYLGYKHEMEKETTNDEIIKILKKKGKEIKEIKKCFDLCSLVEFAKYKSNKNDFEEIVEIVKGSLK